MKRILALLLIIFVCVFFLAGCAKKSTVKGDSCANWFGNNPDWTGIEGDDIAARHGNTPWGIMDGDCSEALVSPYGKYFCGVYDKKKQSFTSCEGTDCVDNACLPEEEDTVTEDIVPEPTVTEDTVPENTVTEATVKGDSCANWFGNNLDWTGIEGDGIAARHGNTPWGIMDGDCSEAIVSSYGEYFCGVYDKKKQSFTSCEGTDCVDNACLPKE